jgi:hypothetical protein
VVNQGEAYLEQTIRLSDASLRRRKTKLSYPDHRLPSPIEDAGQRLLKQIVRSLDDVPQHYPIFLEPSESGSPLM